MLISEYPSWTQRYFSLLKYAKTLDSSITLYTKDNCFSYMIAWVLFIFSFGKFKRETYLKESATTIGNLHFYPKEWTGFEVESTLPHEARHTWQFKLCGFYIHPLVGLPLATLLYIIFPFPIGISFFRFWSELDADKFSYKNFIKRNDCNYPVNPWCRKEILKCALSRANSLSSVMYFYSVPNWFSKYFYNRMVVEICGPEK